MIADRYMIVTSLGSGGMADVYLAIDTILNREVAIKVLRGDMGLDPVTLLRFQREASAISKMHHPNIVEVYDFGEFEDKHYLVMEYVRGKTLKQWIRQRGILSVGESVEIMQQLTSAIAHAHEKDIIHRDIKPQNILVKDDGTIKVTDFGIAVAHDAIQLTSANNVMGSAHYIAPETTSGEVATVQMDIYALGVVFFELLSGTVPFSGENPVQVAMKHTREEFPSIRERNNEVLQSVENIIIKATAKNRLYRYPNAKDMLFDLEACLRPEFENVDKYVVDEQKNGETMVFKSLKENHQESETFIKNEEQPKSKMRMVIAGIAVVTLLLSGIGFGVYYSGIIEGFGPTQYISVPNLEGVGEKEARAILEGKGLTLYKKVEQTLTDDIEKGLVISQKPIAGEKIPKGSSIRITISSGNYIRIEDYVGQMYEDVKSLLESKSKISVIVDYKVSKNVAPGTILEQSLLIEGDKVSPTRAKEIRFVVASAPKATLENYKGQKIEEAKAALEAMGFSVELKEISVPAHEQGSVIYNVVVRQNPLANSLYIQSGDNVITLYYYKK